MKGSNWGRVGCGSGVYEGSVYLACEEDHQVAKFGDSGIGDRSNVEAARARERLSGGEIRDRQGCGGEELRTGQKYRCERGPGCLGVSETRGTGHDPGRERRGPQSRLPRRMWGNQGTTDDGRKIIAGTRCRSRPGWVLLSASGAGTRRSLNRRSALADCERPRAPLDPGSLRPSGHSCACSRAFP